MNVSNGLRRLRASRDITQDEVASLCGISTRTYQNYEAGKQAVPSSLIEKVAAKYAVNIHGLFTGQSHFEDVDTRKDTARLTAKVFRYLDANFESMSMDEKTCVAVEFVGQHRPSVAVDLDNLFESIRIVTGDKYLTYALLHQDKASMDYDDFERDDT